MNKIAVNHTLFITCRLCLEELGLYQIVPNVKEQIAFCFGITIEPYDGLPQLICGKCEKILSNFTDLKKKFIDKQTELRTKIYNAQLHVAITPSAQKPIEGALTKPQVIDKRKQSNKKSNASESKNRISRISSSSSNQEFNRSKNIVNHTERNSFCKKEVEEYTKQYVCKICSSRWSNVNFVMNHLHMKHGHIYKKYSTIFKRHCQVALYKTDGDEFSNKVMLTKGKAVKNVNANYYVIYTSRNYKDKQNKKTRKRKTVNAKKSKYQFSSDSSDEEVFVKRKRSNRICSRSSNDTVVLNNNSDNEKELVKTERNHTPPAEYDGCIDLGDSSETEYEKKFDASDEKVQKQRLKPINPSQAKENKKIVNEIISSCGNKYSKKHYQDSLSIKSAKSPSDIATHLKRKILSIGRKIINKKIRVNCVPLLKFLDHKSLDLSWIPRDVLNLNQDSNYIRILPRIKHVGEKSHSEAGWTYCNSVQNDDEESLIQSTLKSHDTAAESVINGFRGTGIQPVSTLCEPETALISDSSKEIKKLLNANPVANPKQLPKKCITNELKTINTAPKAAEVEPQENNDSEYFMPIITHTTSLAMPFIIANDLNNKPESSSVKTYDQKTEAPRIKVKPASELMSAETLNRMQSPKQIQQHMIGQTVSVQNQKNLINVFIPVVTSGPQRENILQSPTTNGTTSSIASENVWKNEFMILDTVEFPNTRTNSPFLYFRNLLLIHNIILLDTHAELNESFHCLIKFKVVYKQEAKNQPVVLCLSLFCAQNLFCFKVKDRNQENIDLTKITPNWQWEVLKIYKGEVVNKLLNNAQKLGTDVYGFTNKLLCLLKSIVLVQTA